MADYPSATMPDSKKVANPFTGVVVDSNIEGRGPEAKTIRTGAKKN